MHEIYFADFKKHLMYERKTRRGIILSTMLTQTTCTRSARQRFRTVRAIVLRQFYYIINIGENNENKFSP